MYTGLKADTGPFSKDLQLSRIFAVTTGKPEDESLAKIELQGLINIGVLLQPVLLHGPSTREPHPNDQPTQNLVARSPKTTTQARASAAASLTAKAGA